MGVFDMFLAPSMFTVFTFFFCRNNPSWA